MTCRFGPSTPQVLQQEPPPLEVTLELPFPCPLQYSDLRRRMRPNAKINHAFICRGPSSTKKIPSAFSRNVALQETVWPGYELFFVPVKVLKAPASEN